MEKINLPKKPEYIKLAEDINVYSLFQKIEQVFDTCFLFESLGEEGRMSRYSIIGFDPQSIISGNGKNISINGKTHAVNNPYFSLRDLIPQDTIAKNYAGGLVGYLGYDAINFFETSLNIAPHPLFDTFLFGLYTDGIIFDKVTGELFYFYFSANRINLIKKLMKTKLHKKTIQIKKVKISLTKARHKQKVLAIQEEILAGNTFQCELGIQETFTVFGDPIILYTRLRKVNPSPFMYFVKFRQIKIIGASPELLFGMRQKEMTTFPLAGTVKRGKTIQEDMRLARKLLSDKKELAEHKMLVDLHRNDVGRVARFGSVKVRSYMDVKKFSHVQHISSEIVGLLGEGEDVFSALASNFPAGTLTGAPKIESMKIIDRLETAPRGPYGGALGHFGFNGDCTFAIPIRTIFISGDTGFIQAASGIVADSKPEKEHEEIQRKLAAMREVLGV